MRLYFVKLKLLCHLERRYLQRATFPSADYRGWEAASLPPYSCFGKEEVSARWCACAGESVRAWPKERFANRGRGRAGSRASLWAPCSPELPPSGSSWSVASRRWIKAVLAVFPALSLFPCSSESRAAPGPSPAQLMGLCFNYWAGWCRWLCCSSFLGCSHLGSM